MVVWQNKNCRVIKLACIRCNCYVLQIGNNNYLVDTSVSVERKVLLRSLKKNKINRVSGILITHNHTDHVANAQFISEEYNCPIYIAKESIDDMKSGTCHLPHGTTWITKKLYWFVSHGLLQHMQTFTPCSDVRDINELKFEPNIKENNIKIIRTPGHSIDSLSILIEEKIAIVGDVFVCNWWDKKVSLPWAEDMNHARKCWRVIYDSKCQILCEAHGKVVSRELLGISLSKNKV